MAEENETIADILHEMRFDPLSWCYPEGIPQSQHDNGEVRKFADRIEAAWGREMQAHKKELETRDAVIQTEVAAREAEREAHKREKDALQAQADELRLGIEQYRQYNAGVVKECNDKLGNAAKLREALGKLRSELWNNTVIAGKRKFELYEIADAALAAPPRNCNVGTAEEQVKRYEAYCRAHTKPGGCTGCPLIQYRRCQIAWEQLPYTEGGAK